MAMAMRTQRRGSRLRSALLCVLCLILTLAGRVVAMEDYLVPAPPNISNNLRTNALCVVG
jgi:hypothetical protein